MEPVGLAVQSANAPAAGAVPLNQKNSRVRPSGSVEAAPLRTTCCVALRDEVAALVGGSFWLRRKTPVETRISLRESATLSSTKSSMPTFVMRVYSAADAGQVAGCVGPHS